VSLHERCARWLLFLTFVHTIPVVWLTPVAGGTAPTSALLAFGIASLFTFDSEGIGLGMFALLPALVYTALAWVLAWVIGRLTARVSRVPRIAILTVLVVVPLAAVYFPIYVAGGHSYSSSTNVIDLSNAYLNPTIALWYWIGLHGAVLMLLVTQWYAKGSLVFTLIERWLKPVVGAIGLSVVGVVVYTSYATVICRPLAELGLDAAQICYARANQAQARYWYERAAADGNGEAIAWLVDKTPDRQKRLVLLRAGADAGLAETQYLLAKHLQRWGDAGSQAEAQQWLQAAADGNHGAAQFELVEQMTADLLRSGSREGLAERNALLEQAVSSGSPLAKQRLAEHYLRGSMGYVIDMVRSRALYQELSASGALDAREEIVRVNGTRSKSRLEQLDAWQAGLDANEPQVLVELAKLYLTSSLPGPGVREYGLQLFEQVAEHDAQARAELIFMLRTGSDGAGKDLNAARVWLLKSAEAGDLEAMDRVASNYMDGREGFPVDYPQARHWIEMLLERFRRVGGIDAPARIASLENHLRYVDRLGKLAGGSLLGDKELNALAQRTDADSHYRYALQLMAGQGSRRAEAVERLQAAAELGHADAAWRLVQVYERGFPAELDPAAARRELARAVQLHHYDAIRELAQRYENGKKGYAQNLPTAIQMYEEALVAGRDNRYGWNLDQNTYNHFPWLESRLRQAKLKRQGSQLVTTPS
jgi:TPR repeat protein